MWEKVAKHLERLHMTISELSSLTEIPATTIYTWREKGVVASSQGLAKIAKCFGCSMDELM